jgi:preprotein translocase subunit SecF
MELVRPDTHIDFIKQARVCAAISIVAVVLAIFLGFIVGPQLGIDFAGGTVVQVQVPEAAGAVDEGRLRAFVTDAGFPKAVVVRFGAPEERSFLIQLPVEQKNQSDLVVQVVGGLSKGLGAEVETLRIESVGPRVGRELTRAGISALLLSWVLILIYIWFRFELRYAPGAVAALVHDVIITAGIFIVFGLEFNLQVLAALLVVIGYSLNDTIVIYDRIRENIELRGRTHLEDVVNQSINQTLSRTLLTSLTTLLVVVSLLVLGGAVIRDFAIALAVGVVVGTYSTIYVASSLLIFLERRFGKEAAPERDKRTKGARA